MASGNVYDGSTARSESNGLAVAGLVCGIVGLLVFSVILGPLAIVFGSIGLSRANRGAAHRTMSQWAIGLGIVSLVLGVVLIAVASSRGYVI